MTYTVSNLKANDKVKKVVFIIIANILSCLSPVSWQVVGRRSGTLTVKSTRHFSTIHYFAHVKVSKVRGELQLST